MAFDDVRNVIAASMQKARGTDDEDLPKETEDNDGTEFVPSEDPEPLSDTGENDLQDADTLSAEDEPAGEPEPAIEPVVEEPKPEETPAPAADTKPADAAKPEDAFAKEHGIQAKDKRGRENRIPYSQVVRINANAIKKAEAKWTETHTSELGIRDQRIKQYEDRLTQIGETEKIMFGTPARFLGMLINSVPGYRELLQGAQLDQQGNVVRVGAPAQQPTTANAPEPETNDPEPQPDVKMPDGSIGYSPEQHAKLRAWDRRQAETRAADAAYKRFQADFGPVKTAFDATQSSRQQAEQVNRIVQAAYQWPGFAENESAILKNYTEDGKLPPNQRKFRNGPEGVADAYNFTMHSMLTAKTQSEKDIEARIAKQYEERLRRAPRATSAPAAASSHASQREDTRDDNNPNRTTADIVAAAIRGNR